MNKKYTKSFIPSPCISVCTMDEDTGYCRGCHRTLKEISEWEQYDDVQKKALIEILAFREP